jgi:hypothetical protein
MTASDQDKTRDEWHYTAYEQDNVLNVGIGLAEVYGQSLTTEAIPIATKFPVTVYTGI